MEQNTIDAITLFGDKNTKNVVLEKSYDSYFNGDDNQRGYAEIVKELKESFPDPTEIETEQDKKRVCKIIWRIFAY